MTRSQLIARLAESNKHLSLYDAERVVAVFFDEIGKALIDGNRIELRGFGAFSVKRRNARIGRNPRNGMSVKVEEKNVPAFKIGKALFQRMNGLK